MHALGGDGRMETSGDPAFTAVMAGLDPATQITRTTREHVNKAILLGPRVKPGDDSGWGGAVRTARLG